MSTTQEVNEWVSGGYITLDVRHMSVPGLSVEIGLRFKQGN